MECRSEKGRRARELLSTALGVGLLLCLTDGLISTVSYGTLERLFGVSPAMMGVRPGRTAWTDGIFVLACLSAFVAGLLAGRTAHSRMSWRLCSAIAVVAACASGVSLEIATDFWVRIEECFSTLCFAAVWFACGVALTWRGNLPGALRGSDWGRRVVIVLLALTCTVVWFSVGVLVSWYGRAPPGAPR